MKYDLFTAVNPAAVNQVYGRKKMKIFKSVALTKIAKFKYNK